MSEQTSSALALDIGPNRRPIVAQVGPEDEGRLKELLGDRRVPVVLDASADTQGHAASNDLVLDVEGHAIAIRLPTSADAAAVRKAFAMGVVTASLVIGGAAAAVTGADLLAGQQATGPAAPPAAVPQPASDGNSLHLPRPIERE